MARYEILTSMVAAGLVAVLGCAKPASEMKPAASDDPGTELTAEEQEPVFEEGFEGGDADRWEAAPADPATDEDDSAVGPEKE